MIDSETNSTTELLALQSELSEGGNVKIEKYTPSPVCRRFLASVSLDPPSYDIQLLLCVSNLQMNILFNYFGLNLLLLQAFSVQRIIILSFLPPS